MPLAPSLLRAGAIRRNEALSDPDRILLLGVVRVDVEVIGEAVQTCRSSTTSDTSCHAAS